MRYVCNPVDLPYRYQEIRRPDGSRSVHREGADPSIVRFNDRYYMFVSMSRGYFHSDDLATWEYVQTDALPAFDYAPDARVIGDAIYVTASKMSGECPFFRTTDPLSGRFDEVSPGSFAFFDPNLFHDDDGRTYLYWGCSPMDPLFGVEIDTSTWTPIGERAELVQSDVAAHGWERPGENNVAKEPETEQERMIAEMIGGRPFLEGAWVTKHGGTYHLQYASPGTEVNMYADGVYTSDSPLGPFHYSPHSPYSSKPGGFITGAGHGSTVQDAHGNWWHASTMRISVNDAFERRVGIFPAGFDDDGVLFCNQNFADYPRVAVDGPVDPWAQTAPEWMLLSYRAVTDASSSLPEHPSSLVVDEDIRTWWVPQSAEPGEWVSVDLGAVHDVHAIHLNVADHAVAEVAPERSDGEQTMAGYRAIDPELRPIGLLVEISVDGSSWTAVDDTRGARTESPHRLIVLDAFARARFVRVTVGEMSYGATLALSGVRVFGRGDGEPPASTDPAATRTDELSARIQWAPVDGAVGYNVRYGIAPDKLYHSWLLYDATQVDLGTLNAGHPYWVAVDAFNVSGVTTGATIPVAAA